MTWYKHSISRCIHARACRHEGPSPSLTKAEGRRALPEMSHQGVSVVKVHKRAAALADVAGEVRAAHVLKQGVARVHAHIAEVAQRMLQLLMPLQFSAGEVAQLKGKDIVRLSAESRLYMCSGAIHVNPP